MNKNTEIILLAMAVLALVYRKKIGEFLRKKEILPKQKNASSKPQNLTPNQELEREGYIDAIKNSKREYFDRVVSLDNIDMEDIYSVFDDLPTQQLKDMYSMNISEFEAEFGQLLLSKYSLSS